MKKCPTCEKTFEDSMRFCQVDGTPLIEDAPAFDPYATIVARPIPAEPVVEPVPEPDELVAETAPDPAIHHTVGSIPIGEPDDVLDLPSSDPLKTMYVSEAEMQSALSNADIMEIPPIEEVSQPAPPSFIAPEPAPSLDPPPSPFEPAPPPSPFAAESIPSEAEPPVFQEPAAAPSTFEEPAQINFDEAATMIQPSFQSPFDQPAPPTSPFEPAPAAAPIEQWTPPPAPEASWQNQEIGSNTPFQPPPTGAAGQNKTLAIVSLVLGILSFLCCSSLFVVGVAAVITGFMARGKASSNPNEFGGGGLALAGIILGGLSLLIGGAYWILVLSGAVSIPNF
ncbi:MAG TPA: DUF4190 domain-containing protein [Pyrinomonadaceae bacterium]|nr:DUF4190 domain-containing protein [Acidobacteriota bacterium]HQZ97911.1 DUF4190 domain-containing protein [Pyrinomonadaceae bacterium]